MKRIRRSTIKIIFFCLIVRLALPVEASFFLAPPQMEEFSHIFLVNNKKRLREICKLSESISVPGFNPAIKKYVRLDYYSRANLEKNLQWILSSPLARYEETWDCLKEIALHPCGAMILHDVVAVCPNIDDPRELDLRYPYGIVGLASIIVKKIDLKYINKLLETKKLLATKNLDLNVIMEISTLKKKLKDVLSQYKRLSEILENLEDRDNTIARNISVFIANFADEIDEADDSKIFEKPSEIAELFELLAEMPNDLVDKNKLEFLFLSLLYQAVTRTSDSKDRGKEEEYVRRDSYNKVKQFVVNIKEIYKFWNERIIHITLINELYALNPDVARLRINTISIMKDLKCSQFLDQSL